MLKTFINSFVLFFITIDTIGNLPFFLSLTEDAKFKKRTQKAIKSTIIAFFILIAFAYIGRYSLKTSVGSDAQLKTSVVQENMDNLSNVAL